MCSRNWGECPFIGILICEMAKRDCRGAVTRGHVATPPLLKDRHLVLICSPPELSFLTVEHTEGWGPLPPSERWACAQSTSASDLTTRFRGALPSRGSRGAPLSGGFEGWIPVRSGQAGSRRIRRPENGRFVAHAQSHADATSRTSTDLTLHLQRYVRCHTRSVLGDKSLCSRFSDT